LNALQLEAPLESRTKIKRYLGGAWSMHLPFAWDLMKEFKPKVFVEPGVYTGESYFCFCQSVAEHGLATKCYGIDTWRGDIHMGSYGPEIGREVKQYNRRYSPSSKLLKMTFDDALSHFADATIDLLHIDGRPSIRRGKT
jgi:Methyltransferase domain